MNTESDGKQKGKYNYLVVCCAMLSFMCNTGFTYGVIGSVTTAQSLYFNESLATSCWTGSVHIGTLYLVAPLTSVLTKLYPVRVIQFCGGVLALAGIGFSGLSQKSWQVTLLFGAIAGLGASLTRSANPEILIYHLDHSTINYALSFISIGYCVGLFIFPALSELLLESLNLQLGLVALSAFMVTHIIAGLTYSQPPVSSPNGSGENKPAGSNGLSRMSGRQLINQMKLIIKDIKVWCFVISGLFHELGITSVLVIDDAFATAKLGCTPSQAALGNTILGAASIVGVVLTCAVQKFSFSRLMLHGFLAMGKGVSTLALASSQTMIDYYVIVGLTGSFHGAQIANLQSVAYELSGKESMTITIGMEFFARGIGSFIGPPITSFVQERVGLSGGLIVSGSGSVISGLILIPAFKCCQKIGFGMLRKTDKEQENTRLLR